LQENPTMNPVPFEAHRAPDPLPIEEPGDESFDNPHPHHPPVHTPQSDEEPVPDPKPSIFH
jgi:hypothetical protein